MKKFFSYTIVFLLISALWAPFSFAQTQKQASLYVSPAVGAFTVGSTFTVSFYVNTGDQFINVVDADILFPADKLQVVSPSTGASFINVWAIQPSYSNTEGTMSFRGAVPSPGVSTSAGLISTVTFRVKSVGTATIRFGNKSKVLLNDGLGTDILQQMQSGVYTLVLPPPAGPVVASATHSDQTRWYGSGNVSLSWGSEGATGYSYLVSNEPVDLPDSIVDSTKNFITYSGLGNGRHYFHIKALRDGAWGGATHYALNIDGEPPADFPLDIVPSARTAQHEPVIKFFTTDNDSGLDHYEVKLISLASTPAPAGTKPRSEVSLFVETQSPYLPGYLDFGRYDAYVRAYDAAGNFREVSRRIEIVPSLFEVVQGQGIEFRNIIFIPWSAFWGFGLILLIALGIVARRMHWWHRHLDATREVGSLPAEVEDKLKQLKEYQRKYGKAVAAFVLVVLCGLGLLSGTVRAQTTAGVFAPPVITTVSKDIFNDEIFYAGGRAALPSVDVILYVQRLEDGQTMSHRIGADVDGNWFYRHNAFLQSGSYLLWAQAQRGEGLSPPSPQVAMTVATHAVQLGSSRLSYEAVYFVAMILLGLIVVILAMAIWYHYHHGKRKHAKYLAEKAKIEESIRRGFALLRRDIEDEVALLQRIKVSKELGAEEKAREGQLLKDLEAVRRHIGEEVWELEKLEEAA